MYSSTSAEATHTDAAVAQSVERRIGSAEVTGPIPVSSLVKKKRKSLDERICAFLYYSIMALCMVLWYYGECMVLWYYGECMVTEVWMRGNNMVSVLM